MVYDLQRADWGSRPPLRSYVRISMGNRPGIETHHTVGVYGCSTPHCLARAIQDDHLRRGWTDVFYNALIWTDGRIVELRPAYAQSGVIKDLTVVFPGNYETRRLTDEQKVSWYKLRNWARSQGTGTRVRWHKERCGGCSDCPGTNVINWLRNGYPNPGGDWLSMATEAQVEALTRKVVREELGRHAWLRGLMRWISGDVEESNHVQAMVRRVVREEVAKVNCASVDSDEVVDKILARVKAAL